jgi:TonB family protein
MFSCGRPPWIVVVLSLFCVANSDAQVARVETKTALEQVVHKAEPVWPREAAEAKLGGAVIADVLVDRKGAVSSVTILAGHDVLHAPAVAALRQWRFKPFVRGGKPVPVQVILEVTFPDPIKDEERRVFETHRAASYECRRQLEAAPQSAERACAEAVRRADALPLDRVPERSHAAGDLAHALMAAGRLREAIAQMERALVLRAKSLTPPDTPAADAGTADASQILAVLHHRLGDRDKADSLFSTAVAIYDEALKASPEMRAMYEPLLKIALERHAALKREIGDETAASALEARRRALNPPEPVGLPTAKTMSTRTVGTLRIEEPADSRLGEDDLRQIRALIAREGKGRGMWLLQSDGPQPQYKDRCWWAVDAYLEPDVSTTTFRRGRIEMLLTTSCPSSDVTVRRRWEVAKTESSYVQVATSGGSPASEPPIRLQAYANRSSKSTDDVLSIVAFVRSNAHASETSRLLSDIQPWRITEIHDFDDGQVRVRLEDPTSVDRGQIVVLRRSDTGWVIVEMSEAGRRR